MIAIEIDSAGPWASLQDNGRNGWQAIGLPRSGALDPLAHAAANALVGNAPDVPGIELLLGGISLHVIGGATRFALAGADFPVRRDGEPLPTHRSFLLEPGQRLVIGAARQGVVGMLAVEGGIDAPATLGAVALHARAEVGGWFGRALQPGDRLPLRQSAAPRCEVMMQPLVVAVDRALRFVPGPQVDYFNDGEFARVSSSIFQLRPECDRMAYRLSGPEIHVRSKANFISDGVAEGAMQVTGTGQLIVALADRQTIGGYPKLGTVVTADLRLLAQRRAGEQVSFAAVTMTEAQSALRQYRRECAGVGERLLAATTRIRLDDPAVLVSIADNGVSASDCSTWECVRVA